MSPEGVVRNGSLHIECVRESWHRNTLVIERLFGPDGAHRLKKARRGIARDSLVLVNVAWECPWAKSGGVAEIAAQLPRALSSSFREVVRICPLHSGIFDREAAERDGNARALEQPSSVTNVDFDGLDVEVGIYEIKARDGSRWHLFDGRCEDEVFFRADGGEPRGALPSTADARRGTDPYFYSTETAEDRDSTKSRLLRDALFACKAIPAVLRASGYTENLVVHLHDWQLASVAFTAMCELVAEDGCLDSGVLVLTMHNPFDHLLRGAEDDRLRAIAKPELTSPELWPFPLGSHDSRAVPDTVYECMIPLLDAPVAVVSPGFASELDSDPLLLEHFAPHLQNPLAYTGWVGIQNGSFLKEEEWRLFDDECVESAERGEVGSILEEKARRQTEMIRVISSLKSADGLRLAGSLRPACDETVFFHMAGRFDPNQKGFDGLVFAIDRYFERHPGADVRFVVTPMINGLEPHAFVEHLYAATERHDGALLVINGRVAPRADFLSLMSGATWSLWPSLYEPCGAASEPLCLGTPIIARETGGLTRQLANEADSEKRCGIGYREQPSVDNDLGEQWRKIQSAASPKARVSIPLYEDMVRSLVDALEMAVSLRLYRPEAYAEILALTSDRARDPIFSPESFRRSYLTLYETAIGAPLSSPLLDESPRRHR